MQLISQRIVSFTDRFCRNARDDRHRFDVFSDDRSGRDDGSTSDRDVRQDGHAGGNPDVVHERYRTADRTVGRRMWIVLQRPKCRIHADVCVVSNSDVSATRVDHTATVQYDAVSQVHRPGIIKLNSDPDESRR